MTRYGPWFPLSLVFVVAGIVLGVVVAILAYSTFTDGSGVVCGTVFAPRTGLDASALDRCSAAASWHRVFDLVAGAVSLCIVVAAVASAVVIQHRAVPAID